MKSYKELERIFKGISNHRRIQILDLLFKKPELSISEIADTIESEVKNVSAHVNKLAIAGLIMKRNDGHFVRHALTKRGISMLKFVRILE